MRKRLIGMSCLVLMPLIAVPGGASAGAEGNHGIEVSDPVTPVLSPPVRSLPVLGPSGRELQASPRLGPADASWVRGPSGRTAGPIDRGPAVSRMPNTTVEFDGMSHATTAGHHPPDTNADVGPNHIVELVNSSMAVYDKTGTLLAGPSSLSSFWNTTGTDCDSSNDGDPIVLYDEAADRWLMSEFTSRSAPYYECIAISQTSDPTGSWYEYAFKTSNSAFPDYPKLGVWNDSYFMSANLYGGGVNAGVFAFERNEMLVGNPAVMQKKTVSGGYGLLPADLDGPTAAPAGAPGTFVAYINGSPDKLRIYEFDVDWATPANSTFGVARNITVDPFDNKICNNIYECVPQPGTNQKLDSITDLIMFRLGYRNFGSHQDMVVVHTVDVGGRGAIRWYHLRTSGGPWSVQDSGTWSSGSMWRWIPTAAMDKDGNIAIGYNVSNASSVYPGLRFAGRLAEDPAGTLAQGERNMIDGGGSQTSSSARWGDYASMSVDPTDDCTFWFAGEYQPNTASVNWRTRIGAFRFPSCGEKKLSIGDRKRIEGDSGTTKFRFTITLSPSHSVPVTVDWQTVEATAHAPSDYTTASGTVTFAPGQTTKHVAVFVNGDTTDEAKEIFKIKLSGATNAVIVDDTGIGTIKNDD